jgi:hypothetical protein
MIRAQRTRHALLPLLAMMTTGSAALADVPTEWHFELQARSNIVDGFNLPANSSFNSVTPDLDNGGTIAFRLLFIGDTGREGIFAGTGGGGSIVHQLPDARSLSDVIINNVGDICYGRRLDFTSEGVYVFDLGAMSTQLTVPIGGPFGVTGFSAPQINDAGVIGFRGDTGAGQSFIADDGGVQSRYVTETPVDPNSPYAFLFTPALNGAGQIAGKARIGGFGNDQPDEIRLWNADGSSTLIAVDDDGDPNSPYSGFDNGVSANAAGQVAFIANLVAGGRGVFLSDGTTTITIATTNDPNVSDIEFFHPDVNGEGVVAFRGGDASGLQAIFVGDGLTLRRMVGEHDIVPSDLGDARIDQHDGSVVFGGGVAINDRADVAFNAALTPPDDNQIEWGSGMYIAFAGVPGDLDGDGDVDLDDLTLLLQDFGCRGVCVGDIDGDGNTDLDDLTILLQNFGT